jgi:competence protein ComEA
VPTATVTPDIVEVTLAPAPTTPDISPDIPSPTQTPESTPTAAEHSTLAPAATPPTATTATATPAIVDSTHYSADGKLRINYATAAEFQTLPGIGEVLAQRIVDYRDGHGAFKSISAIKNVNGIGSGRYGDIKDMITVE